MVSILFDSSVWIDYFNGRKTAETNFLSSFILKTSPICLCPPVYREVLQGIRDNSDFLRIKIDFDHLDHLILDPYDASLGSANLYRFLRRRGITIHKTVDCLIAYYAIHFKIPMIHNDHDFDLIAKHSELKVIKP